MQAWGFTTQDYRVPTPAELSTLLAHVDYTQVQLDGSTAAIPDDVQVDLGGIAKGYTSDRMMQIFRKFSPCAAPTASPLMVRISHFPLMTSSSM